MAFNWRRPKKGHDDQSDPRVKKEGLALKELLAKYENRIIELEKKVELLTADAVDSKQKITELSRLLTYSINSQKQLSLDMNVVYESITNVAESLQTSVSSPEDDEKYFKWRWTTNDDDDLPN